MDVIYVDGYEGGFHYAVDPLTGQPDSHLECPVGWFADYVRGEEPGVNHRFEIKPDTVLAEVHGGEYSVGIRTASASHKGVIYRQIYAIPGQEYVLRAYAMGRSDACGHGVVAGIDPTGGTSFLAASVRWGDWYSQDPESFLPWINGRWVQLMARAVAEANKITLFLRTECRYPGNPAAHFDDVTVSTIGVTPPPPDGGLGEYIQRLRQALDDLEQFIENGKMTCLPI